jgi:UDP-N-acetylglucosamine acyltransferase
MDDWPFDQLINANVQSDDESADVRVHPTAVVSPKATLGDAVRVGCYSVIGPDVRLDAGVRVASHVLIGGRTTIGEGSRIFPFASVGASPQDLKYRGEPTELTIGRRNTIREYVNIAAGGAAGGGQTAIGDTNLIMAFSHIAHDCQVGSNCVLANAVQLAGHVTVEDSATISGGVGVHQFARIGRLSLIAANSAVLQDVPPFSLVLGAPARIKGLNSVGLRRNGYQKADILRLKEAFRTLFDRTRRLQDRLAALDGEKDQTVRQLVEFVRNSARGICGLADR